MPDGTPTTPKAMTDLWARMPALMVEACEQGVAMEMEIADAMMTAAREIGEQQMELVKAVASAGVAQATAADRSLSGKGGIPLQALGGNASEAFGAIARSLGECSRRIFEANQACIMRSLGAFTGAATKPAEPRKPAAH